MVREQDMMGAVHARTQRRTTPTWPPPLSPGPVPSPQPGRKLPDPLPTSQQQPREPDPPPRQPPPERRGEE